MSYVLGVIVSSMLALPPRAQGCVIDSTASWVQVNRAWATGGGRWTNDSLRGILLSLLREDQDVRKDAGARATDSSYVKQVEAVDRRLSDSVSALLDKFGFPGRSVAGGLGTSALFTLAQHSASLQERVLSLAKQAPPGEAPPHLLATLEDRILVRQGKPQRFGTEFLFGPDGRLRLARVDDIRGMVARRREAGLPPMELYVCLMEENGMRIDRTTIPPPPT